MALDQHPMRIAVLSHSQKLTDRPERYVSKNAANALVRRLLAVRIAKGLIQMVQMRQGGLPVAIQVAPPAHVTYEHHIEPRLERLGMADSDWLAYINGYTSCV